jgi:uncharacterized protein
MPSKEVRDPIHGLMDVRPEEWQVVDTPAFQRLRRIQQLAMTHLVYPGARHSRFEHCMGTCYVASRLCQSIGHEPDDLTTRQVRMAALAHDLGHGPFSHVSEEIFEKLTHGQSSHEKISAAIVRHDSAVRSAMGEETADWVSDLLALGEDDKRSVERDIVAGPADADKMDYLLRDSHYCGVKYGEFDLAKIIESARAVTPSLGSESFLGFHEQGVFPIEEMLLARYHMHRQVYGHKTRVATDRMLVRSMELGIAEGILPRDVFCPPASPDPEFVQAYLTLDDSTIINSLLRAAESQAGEVMRALHSRRLFKRIEEYDLRTLQDRFGQPDAGYIARPTDRRVLQENLHEAEALVADALGLAPHLVSLYWKEFANPISRPFDFDIAGKGIFITRSSDALVREFNDVSQVFQREGLPADMRITLYALVPEDSTREDFIAAKRAQIDKGLGNALRLIGRASAES